MAEFVKKRVKDHDFPPPLKLWGRKIIMEIIMTSKFFTELEVHKCLRKNKNGKSAGFHNVLPEFIEYVPHSLKKAITLFFEKLLDTGEVPEDWVVSVCQPRN